MYAPVLPTDNQLVDDYLKGNEKSFEILLNRHKKHVFAFVRKKIRNAADAEDVNAETWYKIVFSLKANRFDNTKCFVTWVNGIAWHCICDYWGRKNKMIELHGIVSEIELRSMEDSSRNREENYIYADSYKERRTCLKKLPHEQRELLLLHFYFGKEPKELSVQYNIPANHVSHRLCYAVKHLKKVVG